MFVDFFGEIFSTTLLQILKVKFSVTEIVKRILKKMIIYLTIFYLLSKLETLEL